ncbi:MAG: hypothetical protein JWR37_4484, partial [Mycobacterium sp.]|nr:hypothetical protein [Mycobacterium sp.]
EMADATVAQEPAIWQPGQDSILASHVAFAMRRLSPWVAPFALSILGAALIDHYHRGTAPAILGLADALACLAILATVHVFTVQMSASRLPGVLSRTAGQPWPVFSCYAAIVTMLACVAKPTKHFMSGTDWGWASTIAFVIFLTTLLSAMFSLFRRTDAGRAAAGYVASSLPRCRIAGRRLGKVQAKAQEMTDIFEGHPALRLQADVSLGEWATVLRAPRRGFYLPTRRRIRRLLSDRGVREGSTFKASVGFGTIVAAGEVVGAIVPPSDRNSTTRSIKAAGGAVSTWPSSRVEEVAAGAVALAELSIRLGQMGDLGTSLVVAQNLVKLLAEHIRATRVARNREYRQQSIRARLMTGGGLRSDAFPSQAARRGDASARTVVIPALGDSLRLVIRMILAAPEDLFRIPEVVIGGILDACGHAENADLVVALATPLAPAADENSTERRTELVRVAAVRSLQLGAHKNFLQAREHLSRLARNCGGTTTCPETCSVLAATACGFDASVARDTLTFALALVLAEEGASDDPSVRELNVLWRVGAAGLVTGTMSVALLAAQLVRQRHVDGLLAQHSQVERKLRHEAARSDIQGRYLRDSPMDALANFAQFVAGLPSLTD